MMLHRQGLYVPGYRSTFYWPAGDTANVEVASKLHLVDTK